MKDIEFLSLKRNILKNINYYEYSYASFKLEIFNRIRKIFDKEDSILLEVDYKDFKSSFNASLFDSSLIVINLNRLKEVDRDWEKNIEWLLSLDKEGSLEDKIFIFHKVESEQGDNEVLSKLIKYSYYIEEIKLNKTSIVKILNYMSDKEDRLFDFSIIQNKSLLIKSLERYLELKDKNLNHFLKFVEEVIIFCIEGDEFNINKFNNYFLFEKDESYNKMYRLFFNFLNNPSGGCFKDKLYLYFLELYKEFDFSSRFIIYRLMKIIKEFMFFNKEFGSSEEYLQSLDGYKRTLLSEFEGLKINKLLKFSLLLTKFESRLNSGDFGIEMYNLLNEF